MRSPFIPLLILVLVSIAAYATSLPGGFVYDDEQVIVRNERVTDPARMAEAWSTPWWGTRAKGGLYRPLTLYSFALNHRVNGLEPLGWHVVNVLLHALVTLLLYFCALEFLPVGAALAAALLFAAHPVHTEAVANLVGRAELLAALGFFAAWLLHGKNRYLAAAAFTFGVLSKEVAVVLPAALLLRDLVRRRKIDGQAYVLYGLVLAGTFAARYAVLGSFTNPKELILHRMDNVIVTLPFGAGLWTALSVFGRYLVLLVFPWRLSADYSWPQIMAAQPGDAWAWLGTAGLVGLSAAFLLAFRAARKEGSTPAASTSGAAVSPAASIAVGLGLFGLSFFPVSNFVVRIGTVMAERILYLPSAGFLLALAGLGLGAAERMGARSGTGAAARLKTVDAMGAATRRALPVAVALLVLAGTAACLNRNRDWADDGRLARSTVKTSPRSGRAHYNLGVFLFDTNRPTEAIDALQTTVSLDPTYTEAWVNLGGYKMALGRNDEARRDLLAAIATDSNWVSAYITLGGLEVNVGRPESGLPLLERAVVLDSTLDQGWFNLGLARLGTSDTLGAISAFRHAVSLNPEDPDARNSLAWYLVLTGGPLDEALRNAERAVALKPDAATWDTLAEVHRRMGNRSGAREAWNAALRYPGADALIRERLKELDGTGESRTD